jgi:hypothetical protein
MRRFVQTRKGWAIAAVALVLLVAAGAIQATVGTSVTDNETSTVGPPDMARSAPAADMGGGAGVAGIADESSSAKQIAPSPPGDPGATSVVPGSPRVVRTADLRVKVGKGGFGVAFDRVASIAAANGGFVSSSSTSTAEDARSGQVTVRVPADRFDAARQGLGALGEVEEQSIRGEDVSGQLVDYDARLKSLQAQEDALRVLVGQAKAVGEVLQVQSSLFTVRQQIEQLKAQKANLEQSASLSTIQVALFEPGAAAVVRPAEDDRSLARSFEQAVDGMLAVVGGMIVVVGWLVPVAVLGLLVWGGSRLLRRRPAAQVPAV